MSSIVPLECVGETNCSLGNIDHRHSSTIAVPFEPASNRADPPCSPLQSVGISCGCRMVTLGSSDTATISATETASALANLHIIPILGFARPFSIWTNSFADVGVFRQLVKGHTMLLTKALNALSYSFINAPISVIMFLIAGRLLVDVAPYWV